MLSLHELQRAFQRGLLGTDTPIDLLWSTRVDAATGFAVYRNNVASNFREALRDTYPALERVVGEAYFAQVAAQYGRQVPSTSGTLDDFGAGLPMFIASFPGAEQLVYLPDLARLEWALHQVFHAAQRPAIDPARLAAFSAAQLEQAHLTLNPAAALICSPYPILAIWNLACAEHEQVDDAGPIDLCDGPDHLLVLRGDDMQPRIHRLDQAAFALLSGCGRGAAIGEVVADALAIDARFDFGAMLRQHFALGTFVDIRGA